MNIGISQLFFFRSAKAFFNAALSGEPGAYDLTGSFAGAGYENIPLLIIIDLCAKLGLFHGWIICRKNMNLAGMN
jgi:hypothetical protein